MGRKIKNAAVRIMFPIRDTADGLVTGATNLDSEISVDGGSFADCANEATEIGSSGIYYLDISFAENTGSTFDVICKSTEGVTSFVDHTNEPALDSGVAQASGSSTLTLASTASGTNDLYNGATLEVAAGTGLGQIRTIIDYVGSTKIATVDRAWITSPDSTSVYIVHPRVGVKHGTDILAAVNTDQIDGNAAAATALGELYKGGLVASSVNDASATTTTFVAAAGLSSTDDYYNNQFVIFTTGSQAGLAEKISDYTGDTLTITLANALPSAPGNGDEFVILGKSN